MSVLITVSRVPRCIPGEKPLAKQILWSALEHSKEAEGADWKVDLLPDVDWYPMKLE